MKHPGCGGRTRVIDSRPSGSAVWRRRLCSACKARFTTYEVAFGRKPALRPRSAP